MSRLENDPKSLQEILENLSKNHRLSDKVLLFKIKNAIKEEFGEKLERAIVLKSLRHQTLYIEVENSVWKSEVMLRKNRIVEKLNSNLGSKYIENIVVQ